jgi:Glycosyl transferase 4-like domain
MNRTRVKSKRILFFCGSLALGRDGVGDYTRRLALELVDLGCEVRLVSVAERGNGTPESEAGKLEAWMLRIREEGPMKERLDRVSVWLGGWKPEVVSVQLSPFGLVPRGLLRDMGHRLRQRWPDAVGQVMFHELWCGMDAAKAPLRERLLGWLQRQGIKRFLWGYQPAVVHTTNMFYRDRLAACGRAASVLPLAGAFPIEEPESEEDFKARLRGVGLGAVAEKPDAWRVGSVFGTVYSLDILADLTTAAAQISATQGKRLALVFLGHAKVAAAALTKTSEDAGALTAVVGPLPEREISLWMQRSDLGICTTPMDGVGKSSSTAAFLDHGVPVLLHPSRLGPCVNTPWPPLDPLILVSDDGLAEQVKGGWPRGVAVCRAARVAGQFLEDLKPCIQGAV